MTVTQLSVVLDNAPGKAVELLRTLAKGGVNVRAISVADTSDLGVVRLIVSDTAKAKTLLTKKGWKVTSAPVLAVVVKDRPGGLAEMLAPLAKKKLNVDYLYATTCACAGDACGCGEDGCDSVIIVRVKDTKAAEEALKSAGFKTIKP